MNLLFLCVYVCVCGHIVPSSRYLLFALKKYMEKMKMQIKMSTVPPLLTHFICMY